MRPRRVVVVAVALVMFASSSPVRADNGPSRDDLGMAVVAASMASGLPRSWIERVIAVESGGNRFAVSRAGARGLMQLMPRTWAGLQARLGLGPDPFDVRDNVLAGAIYLREMFDRFGAPGFLAAYNAGPARYTAVLAGRAALPPETAAYVTRIAPALAPRAHIAALWPATTLSPPSSGLFVAEAPSGP